MSWTEDRRPQPLRYVDRAGKVRPLGLGDRSWHQDGGRLRACHHPEDGGRSEAFVVWAEDDRGPVRSLPTLADVERFLREVAPGGQWALLVPLPPGTDQPQTWLRVVRWPPPAAYDDGPFVAAEREARR